MNISTLRVSEGLVRLPAPVDTLSFPDQPSRRGEGPLATIDNVRHLLDVNGVTVAYNLIRKRTEIFVPWAAGTMENRAAVSMTHVLSLAARSGMPTGLVPAMVEALADENSFNPAADWMTGRAWDRVDRLSDLCNTVTPRADYPVALRDVLIVKWLISIAAAATLPDGFKTRGVLTLQGRQGLGKTSWGLALVDDDRLRNELIKVDHHLDPSNKDALLGALDHLICEIGELDSTFKRDVARLKGFLTSGTDKIRRPYGKVAVETQRRTVFYATVNEHDFLVDSSGNTRFWTIPVEAIDYAHGIDMQQVFAQCVVLLGQGARWWLTPDEEVMLERQNSLHRSTSVVRDKLADLVDFEATDLSACEPLTASELLAMARFDRPTNAQAKEAAALLREWFGESKRYRGRDKWRVPIRSEAGDQVQDKTTPTKSKFD